MHQLIKLLHLIKNDDLNYDNLSTLLFKIKTLKYSIITILLYIGKYIYYIYRHDYPILSSF